VLVTVFADENMTEDQIPASMAGRMVVGSPESVAEQIKTNVIDVGVDGVIINMPGYVPGAITKVGEALRPVVGL
jgi:alkanesulfonate monooxygenase SsuD/methylene tetrahydromethanopterin reductase-like flavin-dependent oxidoreductase (luciferase family)